LDAIAVSNFLNFLRDCSEQVTAKPIATCLPDPDDLPFLEVAAGSGALLVTGNRKHFPNKAIGGVKVVSPAQLLAMLAQ
jgi:predicted nucleic acid-binding protein